MSSWRNKTQMLQRLYEMTCFDLDTLGLKLEEQLVELDEASSLQSRT